MVDEVVALIKGKGTALIEDLEKRMAEASRMKKFEEAAELRDQLRAVKTFSRRQKVVSSDFEDRDIFAIALEDTLACGLVFLLREGKIINRNHFILAGGEEESEENFLAAFLKQYYLKTDFIPAEIYLPRELPEKTELEAWLSRRRGKNVRLIVPRIGPKAGLMDMCAENAAHLLREYLAQKQAASERISGMVAALRKDLALTTDPRRIKAFDISHTQGTETVASLVVFENGRPRKSDYRKYIIRSAAAGDDYAAMKEAVGRHFRRLLDEGGRRPDLVLIDGGKGQLSAALEALHSLGIKDQAIAGLAKKKEEVFLEGDTESRNIPKDSAGLHLLQRVRDEAHRFAVTFHRNRRGKGQLRSRLDDIPGVGPKRRKALLAAFGSLQGISKASQEEIEAVPGMNRKIAAAILQALRK